MRRIGRLIEAAQRQPHQEALAPVAERLDARGELKIVTGQQHAEGKVIRLQFRGGLFGQAQNALHATAAGGQGQPQILQVLIIPMGTAHQPGNNQPSRHQAMVFGRGYHAFECVKIVTEVIVIQRDTIGCIVHGQLNLE